MMGLCTKSGDKEAVFLIEGELPKEGYRYAFEDATYGTSTQNRAFHSLLINFWLWMNRTDQFEFEDGNRFFDLSTPSAGDFKDFFKHKYGQGYSHIEYVDDKYAMVRVPSPVDWDLIPQYVLDDFNADNKKRIKGVLKSWTAYTKKERKEAIDMLFMIINISGCDDKKVREIMDGMSSNEEKVKRVFGGEEI